MSKIMNYLNTTSEISNKDRLIGVGCTIILGVMGEVLNYQLYKSRMKNLELERTVERQNVIIEGVLFKQEKEVEPVEEPTEENID